MIRRGAVAGLVAVTCFSAVHHLLISSIWAMLPVMAAAGGATGAALAHSYVRLGLASSSRAWWLFSGAHLGALVVLGLVSTLAFEPVTTFVAVSEAGGPVDDLILRALPLSLAWTVAVVGLGVLVHRRRAGRASTVVVPLLVSTLLVLLTLGLNMSALGLVELGAGGVRAVAEFYGLVLLVVVVHALTFQVLAARPGRRGATQGRRPVRWFAGSAGTPGARPDDLAESVSAAR